MATRTALYLFCLIVFTLCFSLAEKRSEKTAVKGDVKQKIQGPVIGIDLGTTYSCVAIHRNNETIIIPNELGDRITASVVSFDVESGERMIGQAAKNYAPTNPMNTLYDVKRLIGRRYSEVLNKDAKLLSYPLVNKDDKVLIEIERMDPATKKMTKEDLTPESVSAMVLGKMKQIAEKYLGEPVKYAVVTVPAYFNDQQRQATKDAGKIAGLEVLRIVNEPTAASMAYGLYKKKEENVMVFDLGGGTFDVSLLTIDSGVFEVIATSGDTHLGGEDFDLRIVEHFVKKYQEKYPANQDLKDLKNRNKKAFQKLKLAAEVAKREVSYQPESSIEIEKWLPGIDFSEKLTRALFEKINKDLFLKTIDPVKQVLKDAGLQKSDVDEVILVGGSTRIPMVQKLLSDFFAGKKLNKEVNPDEAVAYGAAVQAAILANELVDQIVLIDVNPLSLGIETVGGVMATIIPRNTHVPIEKSDIFTTVEDYQKELVVPIYEGERRQTKFNRLLGELLLSGIPPAPKGIPQIKVTFKLDQNSILTVVAEETATGNKKEITIRKGTLSEDEIKKMTKDAEQNSVDDKRFLERVEARNKLTGYIDEIKQQLGQKNIINRIKAEDKKKILEEVKKVLQWLKKDDDMDKTKQQYMSQLNELRKKINPIMGKIFGVEGTLTDDDILSAGDKDDEPINVDVDSHDSDDDKPIIANETPKKEEPKKKKDEL